MPNNVEIPNMFSSSSDETDVIAGINDPAAKLRAASRVTVTPIPITSILPDPAQPRRAIPASLRDSRNLFPEWEMRARRYDPAYSIYDDLNQQIGKGDESDLEAVWESIPENTNSPYLDTLRPIVALAASIYHVGLIQPISLVKIGINYGIESGERRWLAFNLLVEYTQDKRFEIIPARVYPAHDRWRQAVENGARENLSGVSKARQLALLIMTYFEGFSAISDFAHEREFYAQVANGNEYRIPRGCSEWICQSMGIKNPQSLRLIRAILHLSNGAWDIADELMMSEHRIRTTVEYAETQGISLDDAFAQWMLGSGLPSVETSTVSKKRGSVETSTVSTPATQILALMPKLKAPDDLKARKAYCDDLRKAIAQLSEHLQDIES